MDLNEKWFAKSIEEVEKSFETNIEKGLSEKQVEEKRNIYGNNEITSKNKKSIIQMIIGQFQDFMIIVLIIAAIISGIVGYRQGEGFTDSIIILVIVILNAIIGVVQEVRAQKSLDALKNLSAPHCKVVRDGNVQDLESKYLVPGDVVTLETGDFIPADLRLIEAINLKTQESALTGESLPVEKSVEKIDNLEVGIGDRINCAFSSSLVTYGRGKGIVIATGMNTEVGKIAEMLDSVDDSETPLSRRLEALGKTLGIAALAICVFIFIIGSFVHGKEIFEMFMTAVSLAVAAIPEGLPAISTIVLSIGVQRMVKRNAIIRTLPSVETLGSATVICSDKTGTLTQNKMTVKKIFYNNELFDTEEKIHNTDDHLRLLIDAMTLCNDTKITIKNDENVEAHSVHNDEKEGKYILVGDPTETALVDLGIKVGMVKTEIDNLNPRVDEIPFDSNRKLMSTVNQTSNGLIVYTKGGVDELLDKCSKIYLDNQEVTITNEHKKYIQKVNEDMAKSALRVLAMAYKKLPDSFNEVVAAHSVRHKDEDIESDLIYIGMVGMIDPARPEAKEAVHKCKTAGIKPVMITGDHKITAMAIAKDIGILENEVEAITGAELEKMSQEDLEKNVRNYSVYARVSPEHKVRIVKAWQSYNEVVAMTGDGVNDAPALKQADIGAAMGIVGTDVAKEAADVVLTDDNFATIVSAVEEGRRIYDNILKAVQYLLSSNIGEIIILFVATLFGWLAEPLLPIHILWINLVTDSLPALALSVDPAEENIMERKARKDKNIFSKGMVWRIIYQGIMVGILTLVAFGAGCGFNFETLADPEVAMTAQTMAFAVLGMSELVHAFNTRSNKKSIFKVGFGTNKMLILATAVSLLLMLFVLLVPGVQSIFEIAALSQSNWLWVIGLSFAPLVIVEIFKLLKINALKDED